MIITPNTQSTLLTHTHRAVSDDPERLAGKSSPLRRSRCGIYRERLPSSCLECGQRSDVDIPVSTRATGIDKVRAQVSEQLVHVTSTIHDAAKRSCFTLSCDCDQYLQISLLGHRAEDAASRKRVHVC